MKITKNQRCYNHRLREAVVRCPGCGQYFCRECVAEHKDRMLCGSCLQTQSRSGIGKTGHWARLVAAAVHAGAGWLVLCYAFYLLGKTLLAIPHDFHEGTLWQQNWWDAL